MGILALVGLMFSRRCRQKMFEQACLYNNLKRSLVMSVTLKVL